MPDTLWNHQLTLEAIGETKITLPDSIFPNANIDYEVIIDFKNTENEVHQKKLELKIDKRATAVKIYLKNDSVHILEGSHNKSYQLVVYGADKKQIRVADITLPYTEKLEQFIASYSVFEKNLKLQSLDLAAKSDSLQVLAERTKDSLFIAVNNPRNLFFRYQLFKNKKIIKSGYVNSINARIKTYYKDNYYFSIQYTWADKADNRDFDFPFARKPLTINIAHAQSVMPGETADFNIHVTDAFGRPVENADLTAWSITKKFKSYSIPELPVTEKFKSRMIFNEFHPSKEETHEYQKRLDFTYWKSTLGLDSLEFYKFLYPGKHLYLNYSPAEDSITQIAPFIINDGKVQTIHYIYAGGQLKYYADAQGQQPYSFQTESDTLQLILRLHNSLYTINNIVPRKGYKLIVSVDADSLPAGVTREEKDNWLDQHEVRKISPHFMAVKRIQSQSNAYLTQGDHYHLLRPNNYGSEMVGPFFAGRVTYHADFSIDFNFKSKMVYTFQPSLVDRETYPFPQGTFLTNSNPRLSFSDQVYTKARINSYRGSMTSNPVMKFRRYPEYPTLKKPAGSLHVSKAATTKHVQEATYILNLDEPDIYYLFSGSTSDFHQLSEGRYQIIILYDSGYYLKPAPLFIARYGITYYQLDTHELLTPDSLSNSIIKLINKWSLQDAYANVVRKQEMHTVRELYYTEEAQHINFTDGHWYRGRINSAEDGTPLPGVNVMVKGTTIGTVTDVNGEYKIFAPSNSVLVMSFIGLVTQEVDIESQEPFVMEMEADVTQLSEVIVIGYGTTQRMSLTASVNMVGSLQGRVAGVQVSGSNLELKIRGASTLAGSSNPLVIIDGVIGVMDNIDTDKITNIEVLKSDVATAIYGSRAANGVILISTKPGISTAELLQTKLPPAPSIPLPDESLSGTSIRSSFRDYGFWEPSLRTDKNGEVTFSSTFPDDITGWNIYVLGAGNNKMMGSTTSTIQSFKPLAAQLALPRFLTEGDTAWAIGKITNYTADSLSFIRRISINDSLLNTKSLSIVNSKMDSIVLIPNGSELTLQYDIEYNGYKDGEIRTIPVLKSGSKESQGIFAVLSGDTTITFVANKNLAEGKLFIQADYLDILQDEAQRLRMYPYDCNEQLASKLKGLLTQKLITEYRGEVFDDDDEIKKIIKKISSHQSKDGDWSWWGSGEGTTWITLHIAEAFDRAEKAGYKIQFDKIGMIAFLKDHYLNDIPELQLKVLIYLASKGEKVYAKSLIDSAIYRDTLKNKNKINYLKLLNQRLLQLTGEEVDWSWINSFRKETLKGNWYWGVSKNTLWNNDLDNTLLVYQLMERQDPKNKNLYRIQNFFLEKRKPNWANTYLSSKIIEVLLPSFITTNPTYQKPSVQIHGTRENSITKFPFEVNLKNNDSLVIVKTGSSPVYMTAYQDAWIKDPEKVEKDFIVTTNWSEPTKNLKAGKQNDLIVTLEVKKDAEFVMLTIPIPAGCSYFTKEQCRFNQEVHREYDISETRIYCENLPAGKYTYTIRLMPRYKGIYQLNPAKAEWMYFPVIFGRGTSALTTVE